MRNETEDIELLEFHQELEQQTRLDRRSDLDTILDDQPLTPKSSLLVTDSCGEGANEDGNHEIDIGIDLPPDLDHEESGSMDHKSVSKPKLATAMSRTVAVAGAGDAQSGRNDRPKTHRKRNVPKNIVVKEQVDDDDDDDETTAQQLFHLEQFGVYSDLSGEEDDDKDDLCCLLDVSAVALEASVTAGALLINDCANGNRNVNQSEENSHRQYFPTLTTDCCGKLGKGAYQQCYEGLQVLHSDHDDRDHGSNINQTSPKKVLHHPVSVKLQIEGEDMHQAGDVDEDDYARRIQAMIGDAEKAPTVNQGFSSFIFSPSYPFCHAHCETVSRYWERIKVAVQSSSEKDDDVSQFMGAKSQKSLFSLFDKGHQQRQLERKDSLSYSSIDDDGTFMSHISAGINKCQNQATTFGSSNQMYKAVSCALPDGLSFCTIWLDYFLAQTLSQNREFGTSLPSFAIEEADFYIRDGLEVVWKIRPWATQFKQKKNDAEASDLLKCFSWSGNQDHDVVQRVNQVLSEMHQATESEIPREMEEVDEQRNDGNTFKGTEDDTPGERKELEIVLWRSPKRVFPHFVDVNGNPVSAVRLVRENKSSDGFWHSSNDAKCPFGRIVFFVKARDSAPSLISAPSDESVYVEQGEETILEEESGFDEDDDECPNDEEPRIGEWSEEASNVTTTIDNRSRPKEVRYYLEDEADQEFADKFGL